MFLVISRISFISVSKLIDIKWFIELVFFNSRKKDLALICVNGKTLRFVYSFKNYHGLIFEIWYSDKPKTLKSKTTDREIVFKCLGK